MLTRYACFLQEANQTYREFNGLSKVLHFEQFHVVRTILALQMNTYKHIPKYLYGRGGGIKMRWNLLSRVDPKR